MHTRAGQGALSEVLLRRFPRCRMTLLDSSAEMLDRAQRDLAGFGDRVSFILADLMGQSWLARLAPPYGAVVSSLAFHYLGADARPAAFGTIRNLLENGGWFVDADLFDCECDEITERIERVTAGYARQKTRRLRGEAVSLDEMVARRGACSAQSGHCRSTVAAETAQLRAAGFAAGCVWQEWCIAVIAARKSSRGA